MEPIGVPLAPFWGTIAVGPDGEVYVVGDSFAVARSTSLRDEALPSQFEFATWVDLDGSLLGFGGPNPGGLVGQVWVAVDHSDGPTSSNVYLLASVQRASVPDTLDVMFARSIDGGLTWSNPVRVNDDDSVLNLQWFGTMSVAPNGRIDAIWNDTRNTGELNLSQLFYAYSVDAGATWSENQAVSPVFDSFVGWPQQDKLGDYYDMISDDLGAHIAYAATFNGEQDVYYLRISLDCNENGVLDPEEIAAGTVEDCNSNLVPDDCELDFDGDGFIDGCDDDIDADGVPNDPDVCDRTPRGMPVGPDGRMFADTNGNCEIDPIDYERFRLCLLQGGPDVELTAQECIEPFDADANDRIDLADFAEFERIFSHR
jgi:hypothetical protein